MAFARVFSAQTELLSGRIVSVEIDTSRGLNNFTDRRARRPGRWTRHETVSVLALKKRRLRIARKPKIRKLSCLFRRPISKKKGSHFDLSIALGYLIAEGMKTEDTSRSLFIGELAPRRIGPPCSRHSRHRSHRGSRRIS